MGEYARALKAWAQGDPEPLYAYISTHGLAPDEGEAVVALLRHLPKRSRVTDAVMQSVVATVTLSRACALSQAEAADLISQATGIEAETILRNVQRYQKRIR